MEKDKPTNEVKTDLKHDNMEFTTPKDGDVPVGQLDIENEEDEAIMAEELYAIEDDPDNEAAALNATEIDLQADVDILPDEDWTDDLPDKDEDEGENHHRS